MLTLFFLFLGWSSASNAQLKMAPAQDQFEIRGEFDYWTTSANFLAGGGSSQPIAYGGKLTNLSGLGEFSYDFNSRFRAWVGFSGGQTTATVINQAQSGPAFGIVTQNNSTSGLNEGWVGSQYWLYLGDFMFAPEMKVVFPFWRVDQNSTNPLIGDGTLRVQSGSWAMVQLADFTPFIYGGYAYRDSGYSGLMNYSAGVRYSHHNSFWAQVELDGFVSVVDDANVGNRLQREAYLTSIDGGSFQYDSIDPTQGKIAGLVGLQLENFGLYAGLNKSLYGQSSADGWGAVAGLTFDGTFFQRSRRRGHDDPDFVEKSDKYDERVFQEQQPIIPTPNQIPKSPPEVAPPADDLPLPSPAPTPSRRVRKRRKPPHQDTMPDVEMLMKDTQKSLEGH